MAAGTVEVFTVGGGEYLVNVFNAIAAWTSAGGYRGLLKVVMVMAFTMALLGTAWNMDPRYLFKWFMQATLMYLVLMVPTASVKVTDRTNPGLAPALVDNVPIGLAGVASFTSQVGDYLTTSAETVFVMPGSLNYSTGGMIYGAKLLDATQGLRIDDPTLATNLNEHFKQCVFYDVLMGRKTIDSITHAPDILAAIGPGSVSLSQQFIFPDGSSNIQSCQSAYNLIAVQWQNYYNAALPKIAQQFFPGVTPATAQAKFDADVGGVGAAGLGGGGTSAAQLTRQAMFINAMMQARDGFGGSSAQSAVDAFAVTRADIQTRNTYSTIAAGAMKWVPLLNIVLTVVFYAMFPIIFLLSLMPTSGIGVIKGYITGFFYLAAWGPLFVVLNMIFMTRWQSSLASWNDAGLTAANFAGVSAINQDAGALAGYMIMSVPFIAAGMARGAMGIASHSASFLAPSQSAAEQAATEQTTGNYSYGNRQFNNLSANKWDDVSSYSTGLGGRTTVNSDGTLSTRNADGSETHNAAPGMSNLGFMLQSSKDYGSSMQRGLTEGRSVVDQKRQSANEAWSTTYSEGARLFDTAQHSASRNTEEGRGLSSSIAQVHNLESSWSETLQSRFGWSKDVADRASREAAMTGKFNADIGLPIGGGKGGGAKAAPSGGAAGGGAKGGSSGGESGGPNLGVGFGAGGQSTEARSSSMGVSSSDQLSNGMDWLTREANSDSARTARESFVRETNSSSDSQVSGLSRDFQQDLRHAETVSTEASRAEDSYQRWQTEASQFEKSGFTLNRNDSQDFVRFSAEQMLDPSNRHLDHSYHPGLVNLTPSQAMTQDILLGRYMDGKVSDMRSDLGLVPDAPAGTIAGPSATSVGQIKATAAAGMSGLEARGPNVDVTGPGRDSALESLVGDRIVAGNERVDFHGRDTRSAVIGARGDADNLREDVSARNHASLGQTMPIIGNLIGGVPRSGGGAASGQGAPVTAGPVESRLPARGAGFTTYGRQTFGGNQAGTGSFVGELQNMGSAWAATGNAPISYGDMSRPGGGPMAGHEGHQNGREVDVRPFRLDGRNAPTTWNSAQYDRNTTREYVQMVRERHPGATVLFNDPVLIREGLTQRYDGHDNHLHVRLGGSRRRR
jgi:conjugal transfer mating pair stabilization protein TraG